MLVYFVNGLKLNGWTLDVSEQCFNGQIKFIHVFSQFTELYRLNYI